MPKSVIVVKTAMLTTPAVHGVISFAICSPCVLGRQGPVAVGGLGLAMVRWVQNI